MANVNKETAHPCHRRKKGDADMIHAGVEGGMDDILCSRRLLWRDRWAEESHEPAVALPQGG